MAGAAKVRLVVFVPPALADQYSVLSKRFDLSRSELVRLAMQRGYRSLAAWCEKHRSDFDESAPFSPAPVVVGGAGSVENGGAVSSPRTMLVDYCRVLVDQDQDLGVEQVRVMATAQAAVFGVGGDEVEGLVVEVLEQLFPSEASGSAEESGLLGGDLD